MANEFFAVERPLLGTVATFLRSVQPNSLEHAAGTREIFPAGFLRQLSVRAGDIPQYRYVVVDMRQCLPSAHEHMPFSPTSIRQFYSTLRSQQGLVNTPPPEIPSSQARGLVWRDIGLAQLPYRNYAAKTSATETRLRPTSYAITRRPTHTKTPRKCPHLAAWGR